MLNQVEYYHHPAVRRRIADFVRSAEYIVGYGESELWKGNARGFRTGKTSSLGGMLDQGLDILLCMLQKDCSLTLFDMEYYHPKYPGEAHLNPGRVYHLMEPIYQRVLKVHHRFGIPVLAVMTGQGYHFWSRIPFGKKHQVVERLGRLERGLALQYADKKVPSPAARGFSGFSRLQLFLAGEILREIGAARRAGEKIIPVNFSDINPPHGRDAVSMDITTYGDPVHMRDARVPFSCYQKHKVLTDKVGADNAAKIPVGILVPRHTPDGLDLSMKKCLHLRRHFRDAAALAEKTEMNLPDASDGWLRVVRAYKKSKIGAFFHHFDAGPRSYARVAPGRIPPCIRHALRPDQLLEPTQAQAAVRVLDRMGFHPRQIAELFNKIYMEMPWGHYNGQRRAYFWVQSFCALIHAGIDKKYDLTCSDHQHRDRCVQPWCGWDLSKYR